MLNLQKELGSGIGAPGSGWVNVYVDSISGLLTFKNSDGSTVSVGIEVAQQAPAAAATIALAVTGKLNSILLAGFTSACTATLANGNNAGDLAIVEMTGSSSNQNIVLKNAAATTLAQASALGSGNTASALLFWTGAAWLVLLVTLNGAPASLSTGVITAFSGGGASAKTVATPSDVTRSGGSRTIDATLQFAVANSTNYSARFLVYVETGSTGTLGIIAPTGCKVAAAIIAVALNASGIAFSGPGYPLTDGASLSSLDIAMSATSAGAVFLIEASVQVGGSGAGNVGLAWSGSGGSCTVGAGSTLVSSATL